MLSGGVLQTIGAALLSSLPLSQEIVAAVYGYDILLGLGLGLNIGGLTVLDPLCCGEAGPRFVTAKLERHFTFSHDQSCWHGCCEPIPSHGRCDRFGDCNHLRSHLSATVSPQQMANILPLAAEISKLDQDVQSTVREIFGQGYDLHMRILNGFEAAQIPASLLMWGTRGKASI